MRARGRLKMAFRRLDFPTFERPRNATSGCAEEGNCRKYAAVQRWFGGFWKKELLWVSWAAVGAGLVVYECRVWGWRVKRADEVVVMSLSSALALISGIVLGGLSGLL